MKCQKNLKRFAKSFEWFSDSEYKFFLQKNHPKNTEHSLYYTWCSKDINIEHQGRADITRHINGNAHKKAQEARRKQPGTDSIFLKPSNPLESQVRRAEVKVTSFIAERNIPLAVADHLGPLFKDVPYSKKIWRGFNLAHCKKKFLARI